LTGTARSCYGASHEPFDRIGTNPVTGQAVVAQRRRIKQDSDLPMKDDYGRFIADLAWGRRKLMRSQASVPATACQ